MSLTKQDLKDIQTVIVETTAPMFEHVVEELGGRIDKVETRLDSVEARLDGVENRLTSVESRLYGLEKGQQELLVRVERIENELLGMRSDIVDVMNRIFELEKRFPNLKEKEVRELENKLARVIEWAKDVSKKTGASLPKV